VWSRRSSDQPLSFLSLARQSVEHPALGGGQPIDGSPTNRSEEGHMTRPDSGDADSASARIDATIAELTDWRGETLSRIRTLIHRADPHVIEEVKWVKPSNPAGVPTWSHDGIICTGEVYAAKVKLTFAHGASLDDPSGLFNSSLGGSTRRAIDVQQGEEIDARAFEALVKAAVELNEVRASAKPRATKERSGPASPPSAR
jgi:hypothetical protein